MFDVLHLCMDIDMTRLHPRQNQYLARTIMEIDSLAGPSTFRPTPALGVTYLLDSEEEDVKIIVPVPVVLPGPIDDPNDEDYDPGADQSIDEDEDADEDGDPEELDVLSYSEPPDESSGKCRPILSTIYYG